MSNKVLIFDSEKFNHQNILQKIKFITGNPLTKLCHAEDIGCFKEMLMREAPLVMIIVNFQIPDFWDYTGQQLENFVVDVKKCQEIPFTFVAVTSWPNQISTLSRLGLSITHKDYNGLQTDLKEDAEKIKRLVTMEGITQAVCEFYKVSYDKVFIKRRTREVVKVRQISMYLCKFFTTETLEVIGHFFGGRDHTTVIHSCQAVRDHMDSEESYYGEILLLQETVERLKEGRI